MVEEATRRQKKEHTLKFIIATLIGVVAVGLAINFGLMFIAIKTTQQLAVSDANVLVNRSGTPVATTTTRQLQGVDALF